MKASLMHLRVDYAGENCRYNPPRHTLEKRFPSSTSLSEEKVCSRQKLHILAKIAPEWTDIALVLMTASQASESAKGGARTARPCGGMHRCCCCFGSHVLGPRRGRLGFS
jgi:hypothetical protein